MKAKKIKEYLNEAFVRGRSARATLGIDPFTKRQFRDEKHFIDWLFLVFIPRHYEVKTLEEGMKKLFEETKEARDAIKLKNSLVAKYPFYQKEEVPRLPYKFLESIEKVLDESSKTNSTSSPNILEDLDINLPTLYREIVIKGRECCNLDFRVNLGKQYNPFK